MTSLSMNHVDFISDCLSSAPRGTRTLTPKHQILSLACLPFHHRSILFMTTLNELLHSNFAIFIQFSQLSPVSTTQLRWINPSSRRTLNVSNRFVLDSCISVVDISIICKHQPATIRTSLNSLFQYQMLIHNLYRNFFFMSVALDKLRIFPLKRAIPLH